MTTDNRQRTTTSAVLDRLRAEVGCISGPSVEAGETFSTGCRAMDRLLPRGGLRPDAVTEWVAQTDGSGAATLSMIAAANCMMPRGEDAAVCQGPLVVVSGSGGDRRQRTFYPPAAIALGIPKDRIIWVRPTRQADLVWAIDQALRCRAVAAVWAWLGSNLDDRDARRFQLAAETGCTPGLFVRPAATRGRPSFADVRLHVDNAEEVTLGEGRIMKVTLDRCRGGTVGHQVWVQMDDHAGVEQVPSPVDVPCGETICDETIVVRLASELAHPKNSSRKTESGRRRA